MFFDWICFSNLMVRFARVQTFFLLDFLIYFILHAVLDLKKMVKQQIAVETMALSFLLSSFFPTSLIFLQSFGLFFEIGIGKT